MILIILIPLCGGTNYILATIFIHKIEPIIITCYNLVLTELWMLQIKTKGWAESKEAFRQAAIINE